MGQATLRLIVTVLVGAVAMLAGGGLAWAHAGGLTSSASEVEVLAVQPSVSGLTVRVAEYGARLRLDNGTGLRVTVLPAPGSTLSGLPTVAPGAGAYWSDPRVTAAAAQPRPPDGRLGWRIPLRVGERPVTVVGAQRWPPPPDAGLWWLLTALALALPAALVALGGRCGRGDPPAWTRCTLAAATTVVVGAHVAHVYGSSLVPEQGALVWVFLAAAGFAVVGWPIGIAGAVLTVRARPAGPLLCCVAGALLAVIIAPADVLSFHDAVVPFAWGADLDRALIALTVGGGLGVVAAATVLMRRAPHAPAPPQTHEQ